MKYHTNYLCICTAIVWSILLTICIPKVSCGQDTILTPCRFNGLPQNSKIVFFTEIAAKDTAIITVNNATKKKNKADNSGRLSVQWEIDLVEGENKIGIVFHDLADVPCRCDTVIDYRSFGYWILSVGTGEKQKYHMFNLRCSTDDARTFDSLIQGTIGIKPELHFCLVDSYATKDSIIKSADSIGKDIKRKSKNLEKKAVFIYFSGHGEDEKGNNSNFRFQVNDSTGFMNYAEILNMIATICGDETNLDVWIFLDACESSKFDIPPTTTDIKCSLIINSSMVKLADKETLYLKEVYYNMGDDYCDNIKRCDSLSDITSSTGEIEKNLSQKAIDGLYVNFLKRALSKGDKIDNTIIYLDIAGRYNTKLPQQKLYGPVNDRSAAIQKNGSSKNSTTSPTKPSCFYDFSIGYNFSKQLNNQTGISWESSCGGWSIFAEFSGYRNWTDSLKYIVKNNLTQEESKKKMPSKNIFGIGAGVRWYPFKGFDYFGFSVSTQIGGVFGEMIVIDGSTTDDPNNHQYIQTNEKIQGWRNFVCVTPSISIRLPSFKKYPCRLFIDAGYAFYFSSSDIDRLMNCEMDNPPIVLNAGVSIPVCYGSKTRIGGKK